MGDTILEIDGHKIVKISDYYKCLGYDNESKKDFKILV